VTVRWGWCARLVRAQCGLHGGIVSWEEFPTLFSRCGAALVLALLMAPLFSCGGTPTPSGSTSAPVQASADPPPSTSPLDCQSSQCISLPAVVQTRHKFQFWYEIWDPSTTPGKLAWADVVIGLNGIAPPTAVASAGSPQMLVYVTYYQDTYEDVGGVSQTFMKTAADVPLLALERDGVVQTSAFTQGNPGWYVLCDNSTELRSRVFAHLAVVTKAGYGGLFVDNAAQVPQTCTSASHQHLNPGQRSDDAYLTLLDDVQAQLKQLAVAPLLIANAGDPTVADQTGTGSNMGLMWTIPDFVLWEGYGYYDSDDPDAAGTSHDQIAATVQKSLIYGADANKAAKVLALSYPETQQEALLSFAMARIFGFAWTANLGDSQTEGHWGLFAASMPWSVGNPQGNLYVQGGLLARLFTNGVAYANTGATAVTVNMPQAGQLVTVAGQSSVSQGSSLSLDPHAAAVLLFQ
jgi:hypothetical protein